MRSTVKVWHLLPLDETAVRRLASELGTPPIVAHLLHNRGLATAAEARRFLDAPLKGLHDPELLPGVTEAAKRLLAAVQQKRRICIYGDYDVDGVTGTAILHTALRLLGGRVEFHIPSRLDDGYGLNAVVTHGFNGNSFHGGAEKTFGPLAVRGGARFSRDHWDPTWGVGFGRRVAVDVGFYGTHSNLEEKQQISMAISIRIMPNP